MEMVQFERMNGEPNSLGDVIHKMALLTMSLLSPIRVYKQNERLRPNYRWALKKMSPQWASNSFNLGAHIYWTNVKRKRIKHTKSSISTEPGGISLRCEQDGRGLSFSGVQNSARDASDTLN